MSGWEGSTRHDRLPPDWDRIRELVLLRDGHRCTFRFPNTGRCPRYATDVDHVRPGDDHRPDNLTSLCRDHHNRKSAREGQAARQARRTTARPAERHPGRIDPT